MMPDEINLSDAILLALHNAGDIKLSFATKPLVKRKHTQNYGATAYEPTLPGVTYDKAQHRIVSQLWLGKHNTPRSIHIGHGPPSWKLEQELHAAWVAKRAELGIDSPKIGRPRKKGTA